MVLTLLTAVTAAFSPVVGQTSLSIYEDGRVVVRQSVAQPLTKGRNVLTVPVQQFRTGTLFSADSLVTLVSGTVFDATTRDQALQRAIGQTLSFVRAKGDTVRATVLSVSPPQYRLAGGRVVFRGPDGGLGGGGGWAGGRVFPPGRGR